MSVLQYRRLVWCAVIVLGLVVAGSLPGQEGLRRIRAGEPMPAFSLSAADGKRFVYDANHDGVLGVVFLKTGQDHFTRIADDLETVVKELKASGNRFDCVGVMSGPGAKESLQTLDPDGHASFPVLLDPTFELWGKLGVIAAPTAVVVGADHKVRWAKAGYGYDFIPNFRSRLAQALGIRAGGADGSVPVETLKNASSRARFERHAQMARSLAARGRFDMAIAEFKKARALDPNTADVVFELGELLCRAGEHEAALEIAGQVQAKTDREKGRALLICGWARRRMGELDIAQSLLTESLKLNLKSPRALYELGQVFQAKGDMDEAVAHYRRALALVFEEQETAAPGTP
ncbi:MAG: tetratricopeptide repeat protein [Phycisphaerales bacterium]|nr:MAG: tetratricopeptide repeat protein [Phycisphaerales bacterium]